jgi:TrmH family RNA methyltransferase
VIRRVRELRRDGASRCRESVFVAEGLHLAEEALAAGAAIELVLFAPRLRSGAQGARLLERLEAAGLECLETSDAVLDSLQDARSPQPVLVVARLSEWGPEAQPAPDGTPPLVVVAHAIQDPGNLGALVRTADAAGATAFVVCGESADPLHPRAVRATMGSIFRLPPGRREPDELLAGLREREVRTVGADLRGSTDLGGLDLSGPVAIFFGREAEGLPAGLRQRLDSTVRIPMRPGVESLSVGAAAAVILFEAARQRRPG